MAQLFGSTADEPVIASATASEPPEHPQPGGSFRLVREVLPGSSS